VSVELATAYVNIQASTKGLGKDITSTMGGAGTDGGQVAAKGFRQKFTGGLKGIGKVAGPLLGLGLGVQAFDWIKQGTLDAQAMNSTLANMTQQLKTTGGASGKTVAGLKSAADAMEMKIGVDAQEIVEAQSVLLTFTKVSGKEFDKATGLAFDMAAVLGGDAKSASMQLGKALNDPVKGMTSLSRAGVQFTAQQKEQVKAMIASGDVTGAQGIILKELETQFGGTAEKSADSTAKIGLMFDNMKEEVGAAVIGLVDKAMPHLQKFGEQAIPKIGQAVEWVGKTATPIIKNIAETFMRNWPQIKETAMSVMAGVTGAVRTATGVVKVIGKVALPILKGLVGAFNGLPGPAKSAAVGVVGLGLAAGKIGRGIDKVKAMASTIKSVGGAAISAGKSLATGAVSAGKWAVQAGKAAASGAKSAIVGIGNAAKTAGAAALSGAKSLGTWALAAGKSAASAIASTASIVAQKVAMLAGKVATGVATAAQWLWNAALTANPIGLVIAAIVGIVAALVLAYNKVGWFKAFVDAAFRFIGAIVKWVAGVVSAVFSTIWNVAQRVIGWIVGYWKFYLAAVTTVWNFVWGVVQKVIEWIRGVVSSVVNTVKRKWDEVSTKVRQVWQAIKNIVGGVVDNVRSRVASVVNNIRQKWDEVSTKVRQVWQAIKNIVGGVVDNVRSRVASVVNNIRQKWDEVSTKVRQVWQAIKNIVGGVVDNVRSRVASVVNNIRQKWDEVSTKVRQVWQAIKNIISDRIDSVKRMVESAKNKVSAMFDPLKNAAKKVFNTVAKFWNNTIGKLSFTAPSWVPGIGGKGFSMPQLPTYHTGGEVLGPRGQEVPIMALGGERVLSLQETAAYESGMSGQPINLTVNALSDASPDEIASVVISRLGWAMNGRAA
jgi:phage-related protein